MENMENTEDYTRKIKMPNTITKDTSANLSFYAENIFEHVHPNSHPDMWLLCDFLKVIKIVLYYLTCLIIAFNFTMGHK